VSAKKPRKVKERQKEEIRVREEAERRKGSGEEEGNA